MNGQLIPLVNFWFADPVFAGTRVMAVVLLAMYIAKSKHVSTGNLAMLSASVGILLLAAIYLCIAFYLAELFVAYFSGSDNLKYAWVERATGKYWWSFWSMLMINFLLPQFFLFKRLRTSPIYTFIILLPHLLAVTYLGIGSGLSVMPDLNTGIKLLIYALELRTVFFLIPKPKAATA